MIDQCPECGSTDFQIHKQIFYDKSITINVTCNQCGSGLEIDLVLVDVRKIANPGLAYELNNLLKGGAV
jgi:uncharacterized Zn finger protein